MQFSYKQSGYLNGVVLQVIDILFQSHPEVVQAGKDALDKYGAGLASVRLICGTQNIHVVSSGVLFLSFIIMYCCINNCFRLMFTKVHAYTYT